MRSLVTPTAVKLALDAAAREAARVVFGAHTELSILISECPRQEPAVLLLLGADGNLPDGLPGKFARCYHYIGGRVVCELQRADAEHFKRHVRHLVNATTTNHGAAYCVERAEQRIILFSLRMFRRYATAMREAGK